MKLSIITPSFNSVDTLKRAIDSVLIQDSGEVEHIVVDGGSTDGTIDLLKRYSHVKWISEPDGGQVDAMRKGFAISTGDIIGNLNADDHYLPGAFATVLPHFVAGADFVVGRIEVRAEHTRSTWINDPEVELPKMLKHWLPDAFCVNPIGYFYRRAVQESIPFNSDNDDKHDLELLLEAGSRFTLLKINALLGVFEHVIKAKTFQQQMRPSYWNVSNFQFVEHILANMDAEYQRLFRLERERGYQVRRHWAVNDAGKMGFIQDLIAQDEMFPLPHDGPSVFSSRCGFVDFDQIATPGDWVIVVLTAECVAGKSIVQALNKVPRHEMDAPVYHTSEVNEASVQAGLQASPDQQKLAQLAVGLAVQRTFEEHAHDLEWRFIVGVRDPIASALDVLCEIGNGVGGDILPEIREIVGGIEAHFDLQYRDTFGVDVYMESFCHDNGFSILKKDSVEVMIYRFEDLPRVFGSAMEAFLGLSGMTLSETAGLNEVGRIGESRKELIGCRFDREFLDEIYSSRYVRHFYSNDDVSGFYRKWVA